MKNISQIRFVVTWPEFAAEAARYFWISGVEWSEGTLQRLRLRARGTSNHSKQTPTTNAEHARNSRVLNLRARCRR